MLRPLVGSYSCQVRSHYGSFVLDCLDRFTELFSPPAHSDVQGLPRHSDTTMAKLLAYAVDVRRFASAKALAVFIGVAPQQCLSGKFRKGGTMMSRTGHADLRRALYIHEPGCATPQLCPLDIWRSIERYRTRAQGCGRSRDAQAGAADLRGEQIRQAV